MADTDSPIPTSLYEVLELAPAWTVLVGYLAHPGAKPREVDARSVYESALDVDYSRLVALLYAHGHGDSLDDAEQTLLCLLALASEGRRPRYGRELLGGTT